MFEKMKQIREIANFYSCSLRVAREKYADGIRIKYSWNKLDFTIHVVSDDGEFDTCITYADKVSERVYRKFDALGINIPSWIRNSK